MMTATDQGLAAILLALAMMGGAMAAPPASAPAATPLDLRPFFEEVDANHDGCISAKEWFGAGLPASAYGILKDDTGCVTPAKMRATAPPPGIDLNGDGKLTAAEFREFDRRMAPPALASSTPKR